jgi:hypothetical protein
LRRRFLFIFGAYVPDRHNAPVLTFGFNSIFHKFFTLWTLPKNAYGRVAYAPALNQFGRTYPQPPAQFFAEGDGTQTPALYTDFK